MKTQETIEESAQIQAALNRVIATQQAEIDGLQMVVSSRENQDARNVEKEKEIFQMIDKLLDFKLRPYWKDDQKQAFETYCALLHELRMHLLDNGWCLRCGDWAFDCGCHDE